MQLEARRIDGAFSGLFAKICTPPRRVFVGVIDPINPKVETPQDVRDRVLASVHNYLRFCDLCKELALGTKPYPSDDPRG